MHTIEALAAEWRERAAQFRNFAGHTQAEVLETCAAQLEKALGERSPRSPAPSPGALLTAPEVATRLGCDVQRVYELCRTERLPCIRIGRQVRVASGALEEWIMNGGSALAG